VFVFDSSRQSKHLAEANRRSPRFRGHVAGIKGLFVRCDIEFLRCNSRSHFDRMFALALKT
jgi:hypothetical protein